MHHLKDENGTIITDRVEIANKLGSSENYYKEFQSIKAQNEKQKVNFKTNRKLCYDKKFTMRHLKRSLKSPIIHLQAQIRSIMKFYATFLLRLHISLNIINETWKSDTITESWREALEYFNA